jgi:hypothetical protein
MIKYTEKGQEGRSSRLAELRSRVAKLKRLNSHKDTDSWKDLKSILEGFVESEKNSQRYAVVACAQGGRWNPADRSFEKESDSRLVSDVRIAYEREQAFQLVIDLIEKTDEQIDHIEGTIKSIEKTFKEAKEQLE